MRSVLRFILLFTLKYTAIASTDRRATSHVAVTEHVLNLTIAQSPYPVSNTLNFLTKRFHTKRQNDTYTSSSHSEDEVASIQQKLRTFHGRVYMTNISFASQTFTVVIDTGSSDTWVASSPFQCLPSRRDWRSPRESCAFGSLYDPVLSSTFESKAPYEFSVSYTDGEWLEGDLGVEDVEIGGLTVRQVVGVPNRGWWLGDGISSGLMGLSYPVLASHSQALNYTSVLFSILQDPTIPPLFSLALSRPTAQNPIAGGLLAIGGIPSIPTIGDFVAVPMNPAFGTTHTFYSITIDGFDIRPPALAGPSSSPVSSFPATGASLRATRSQVAQQSKSQALPLVLSSFGNFTAAPLRMVIDSGSTLVYLPDDVTDHVASLASPPAVMDTDTGLFTIKCSAAVPAVGIVIGGQSFFIAPLDLKSTYEGSRERECVFAVQRTGNGDHVLGDAFLKGVVAVFDVGDNTMRFAARAPY